MNDGILSYEDFERIMLENFSGIELVIEGNGTRWYNRRDCEEVLEMDSGTEDDYITEDHFMEMLLTSEVPAAKLLQGETGIE